MKGQVRHGPGLEDVSIDRGIGSIRGEQLTTLARTQRRLGKATERLASGLRINSARDDAAGLAISESLEARNASRKQAKRNIHDGISLLQIAEGGMSTLSGVLGRMRELALQSANGTYGDEERAIMQAEVEACIEALDDASARCKFGDRSLLRGPAVDVAFLVDSSASMGGEIATLRASVEAFRDEFLSDAVSVQFALVEANRATDTGDATTLKSDLGDASFRSELDALSLVGGTQDPYAVLYNASGINDTPGVNDPDAVTFRDGAVKRLILITDTGRETSMPGIDPSEGALGAALAAEEFVVDVIGVPARAGVFDGIVGATGGAFYSQGDGSGSNIPAALTAIADQVKLDLAGTEPLEIQLGPDDEDRIRIGLPVEMSASGLGVSLLDVSTAAGALDALGGIDRALDMVSEGRASIGASQNRLEMAADVTAIAVENEVAARARITDADIAAESAELSAASILAQGAVALVAQTSQIDRKRVLTLVGDISK